MQKSISVDQMESLPRMPPFYVTCVRENES